MGREQKAGSVAPRAAWAHFAVALLMEVGWRQRKTTGVAERVDTWQG